MKIFISGVSSTPDYEDPLRRGKAYFSLRPGTVSTSGALLMLVSTLAGCSASRSPADLQNGPIRVLLDRAPGTLNPRIALDHGSQRLGELLFGALTHKDQDMNIVPDFAESWKIEDRGKLWRFQIRNGLQDHAGEKITSQRLASCLEEYRVGKPSSPFQTAFPTLQSIEAQGSQLLLKLSKPDPYLSGNLSLLRYFTTGDPSKPCRDPKPGETIVGSGAYRAARLGFDDLTPEHRIELIPVRHPEKRRLLFSWSLEDGSKALKLIRGEVDVLPSSLSLSKTRWIQSRFADRFEVVERANGVNVSYLAFNLKHPALQKLEVRKAIAHAIDREDFVRNKLYGFGSVAGSLLSPALAESSQQKITFDPKESERLLDQAGYPRGKDGVRLQIRFKTTPVRDGLETSLVLQSMLARVGIRLVLEVVEPAVFFASLRKGAFEMCTSRWIGVSDASIFDRVLRTGTRDNRGKYSSPEMDALLDQTYQELDPLKRNEIFRKIQAKVFEDLPFLPLWYWNPAIIHRRGLSGLKSENLSLSGSLEPLSVLR